MLAIQCIDYIGKGVLNSLCCIQNRVIKKSVIKRLRCSYSTPHVTHLSFYMGYLESFGVGAAFFTHFICAGISVSFLNKIRLGLKREKRQFMPF